METRLNDIFFDLTGNIPNSEYCFFHRNGKVFIKRRPTFRKKPTEAQLQARQDFINIYSKLAYTKKKK